jgi:hypothetical protein
MQDTASLSIAGRQVVRGSVPCSKTFCTVERDENIRESTAFHDIWVDLSPGTEEGTEGRHLLGKQVGGLKRAHIPMSQMSDWKTGRPVSPSQQTP